MGRVDEMRSAEIAMIRTRAYVRALSSVCLWTAPAFAVVATFSTYVFVGHTMDQKSLPIIFTAMMLFNNLRFPLMMYPMVLTQCEQRLVALRASLCLCHTRSLSLSLSLSLSPSHPPYPSSSLVARLLVCGG